MKRSNIRIPNNRRPRAAIPFFLVGGPAIVAGGLIAAAVAHEPTRLAVWTAAYLVLVVGVAQVGCGVGRVYLARQTPSATRVGLECSLFNSGNAGVIAGTLCAYFPIVLVGGLLIVATLALWLHGVRRASDRGLLHAYRLLLTVILIGALVGVTLSAVQAHP